MGQSLVSKLEGALPTAFDDQVVRVEETKVGTPYAIFVSPKASNWPALSAAIPGLAEPDVVLIGGEKPVRVSPFKFQILAAQQYWGDQDDQGQIHSPTFVDPGRSTDLREFIDAALLVFFGEECRAARMTFKGPKCGVAKAGVRALKAAQDSDAWGSQGAMWKLSLGAPKPYLRFYVVAQCRQRTSRSSGFAYWQAEGRVEPAGPAEWKAFAAYLEGDGAAEIEDIARDYRERLEGLKNGRG